MSQIMLPQIPFDDATLARSSIQDREDSNIPIADEAVTDAAVLQNILAEDQKHTSHDSYFSTSLGQPRNITFASLSDDQDIQNVFRGNGRVKN